MTAQSGRPTDSLGRDQASAIARDTGSRDTAPVSSEVEQLRAELQQARDELRHQEQFVAVIAHELRNPITPVMMSLEALILQLAERGIDQETLLRRLQLTRRYVETMRDHLDKLLEFSRLRSGHIELAIEDVDLSQLVGNVLDGMQPMLQAARCELHTSLTIPLRGRWDSTRVTQVIWNLVSNAAKYAAGAPIDIKTVSLDGDRAQLIVADHGPGIAPEKQAAVFRQFERVSADTHHTGFGVGLWLVRRLVDAMGGSIELTSDVGKGATFIVTLPRSSP